jgi:uncharacterized protein YecT (DUF1311 family)
MIEAGMPFRISSMTLASVLGAIVVTCIAHPALGQAALDVRALPCDKGNHARQHECRSRLVRQADATQNVNYGEVIGLSNKKQARALVEDQRAFLESRDRACGVDKRARARAAWILHVADSHQRCKEPRTR